MDNSISHIFSRFVEKRTGGGYCMQVNVLYREMLSFLRFRFIGVIGRVYSPVTADWTGLTHTGTLVYLPSHLVEDKRKKVYYLSDVGIWKQSPSANLAQKRVEEYGRGTDKFRVVKETIQPRSTLEESDSDSESTEKVDDQVAEVATTQGCWKLQVLKKGKSEWEDCYSFTTFECFSRIMTLRIDPRLSWRSAVWDDDPRRTLPPHRRRFRRAGQARWAQQRAVSVSPITRGTANDRRHEIHHQEGR